MALGETSCQRLTTQASGLSLSPHTTHRGAALQLQPDLTH